MLRRTTPYLVATLVAIASIAGLVVRPATGAPTPHVDYVIIAGAAGLRWDDINPTDTPNLWRLAGRGSIGALSVRSARSPTCPADGWLELGAGNYAQRTSGPVTGECPPTQPEILAPDGIGARLPDQETDVAATNRALPYGAQPGALAEAVRCTVAVGPGAAVAAARPFGRVDRYEATLPKAPAKLLSGCVLSIVDLGTVSGTDPMARRAAARAADATLAKVLAARPTSSLLMVAGLADTDRTSRLHVVIADGPGYRGGWLTSASTSRPGYLQLTDLAPTALNALDRPAPTKLFAGTPAGSIAGRPADVTTAVAQFSDADREAGAQRRVAGWFLGLLALAELALFIGVIPLLRRARRSTVRYGRRTVPRPVLVAAEVLLVAAALTVPGALLVDAVPWWRTGHPVLIFSAVTLAVVSGLTALILLGPWRRGVLGPLGAVGALAAGIVGVDVLTGARLQLNGVAGYSALAGVRYAGVGTIGLGLFIAGILLLAGCLAQRLPRRWRPAMLVALGAVGVVLVGSPYLGADAGGAVALTAGVAVAAAICTGGFVTFPRVAWATLAGVAVTTGFALLDLRRPEQERGSLGRFLTAAQQGTSGTVIHRTAAADGIAVFASPLSLVVIGALVLVVFALLRPWGGLKRLFGIHPSVRAGLVGVALASLFAGFVDGAGFEVAGAAAAVTVPLAALAALRVLDHADDRTVAASFRGRPVVGRPTGAKPERPSPDRWSPDRPSADRPGPDGPPGELAGATGEAAGADGEVAGAARPATPPGGRGDVLL